MPLRRQVKSLWQMSSLVIARQLAIRHYPNVQDEEISSTHDENNSSVSKCIKNPFDDWPSYIVEQIVDALIMEENLDVKLRDLVTTTMTSKLDLNMVSGINDESTLVDLLELVAARCPQLNVLIREYYALQSCTVKCYNKLLPQLTHLQVLVVSSCRHFDDSCMHLLGIHCTDLRELDISECCVSDDGIQGLCGGTTEHGNKVGLGKKGQCKSLREFLARHIDATPEGINMAFRQLPHLEILDVAPNYGVIILPQMHRNDLVRPKYTLTELSLKCLKHYPRTIPYTVGDLSLAASMCPFVTRVSIDFHNLEITDSDLLGLIVLERLSELRLETDEYYRHDVCTFTFDGGLAPILKALGRSLKALDIEHLRIIVRFNNLIEYCPNLERLGLYNCIFSSLNGQDDAEHGLDSRPSKRPKKNLAWTDLKVLSLREFSDPWAEPDDEDLNMTSEILFLALSLSPNLKKLKIEHWLFDDNFLQEVLLCNSFKSLEQLKLFNSPVTPRGINLLMTEENSFKKIKITCFRSPESVCENDIHNWNEESKNNNWDFVCEVEWY